MVNYKTLEALLTIWNELPDLVGAGWPTLEARLCAYLEQFEAADDEEARARVSRYIQRLLEAEVPQVLARLDEVVEELERGKDKASARGVIGHLKTFLSDRTSSRTRRDLVTRYTDISCPRQVWVEAPRISVVVRLTVRPPEHSAAVEALAVQAALPVSVRVEAPGFEMLNASEQETLVEPDADSAPVVFDLRPHHVGPTRINLDFFQAGNPVGTVSVPVEITTHRVADEPASRLGQALHIDPAAQAPDLML